MIPSAEAAEAARNWTQRSVLPDAEWIAGSTVEIVPSGPLPIPGASHPVA
jgi:hypothetical protein